MSISHISHALFFDQMPLAGQHSQDARDDLVEQCREFLARERGRRVEYRRPFCAGVIDAIEHQSVNVSLQELIDRKLGSKISRADLFISQTRDGELLVTSRQDGTIRMLVPDSK